jgi:transcriptional regulator with XRE-family HTH domain
MGIEESGEPDASSASDIGVRIAEARAARGLTSSELEERVGLHKGQVAEIEAGQRPLEICELVGCASALGVTARQLLGQPEPPYVSLLGNP